MSSFFSSVDWRLPFQSKVFLILINFNFLCVLSLESSQTNCIIRSYESWKQTFFSSGRFYGNDKFHLNVDVKRGDYSYDGAYCERCEDFQLIF